MAWPWHRVLLAALCLALGSEALQFFATDRHPRWVDVGIDMAGALTGLGLVWGAWIATSLRSSQ
jgi:VanZ family protein